MLFLAKVYFLLFGFLFTFATGVSSYSPIHMNPYVLPQDNTRVVKPLNF